MCDTLASECESWGDGAPSSRLAAFAACSVKLSLPLASRSGPSAGTDPGHHCHATGEERSWQMARTARQAQQAAAQAHAPPLHPVYGGGGYGGGGWAAPVARVGPPTTVPGVLPAGHVRQPPSAAEHLPDPATLPGLLHLSSLRLAVKLAKDGKHTLGEIQTRLAPFGLCVKDLHMVPNDTGPLGLRALFATSHYSASPSIFAIRLCCAAS